MGGFFGAAAKRDVISDVFFGTDYHSHLGTRRGGMAAYDKETGMQRDIHNIQNSPFRTKFEHIKHTDFSVYALFSLFVQWFPLSLLLLESYTV